MRYTLLAVASAALSLGMSSCMRNQTTQNYEDSMATDQADNAGSSMEEDMNKSRTILYTLPTPIEMASLVQETGTRFDDQILSQLSQSDKYTTNIKMALNLGVYTADMSFAGMFNQSQKMVDYLNTINGLTKKLGIVNILDEGTIARLENSEMTRKEALNVISEVYMNANQNLKDNNRRNIATIVMAGGWVEGLYIALNMVNPDKLNKDLVGRIVAQKLAMATMLNIIETQDPENSDADLKYIKEKMEEINEVFSSVEVEMTGRVSAITDPETHTTSIKANTKGELDKETLLALRAKVSEVREEFVK